MKCEGTSQAKGAARCRKETDARSFELFDYCAKCGKNLCEHCMEQGRCREGGKHVPANHGDKP